MAKRPKAHTQNNTIRNVAIIFCAIVIVTAAALVWNNRSLSYAGTLDGARLPVAQLNFFAENLGGQIADFDLAREFAWGDLVDFHLVTRQADDLGIALNADDMEEVDEIIAWYESQWVFPEFNYNLITSMGFTNSSFRQFMEQFVLRGRVVDHVTSFVEIDEEVFARAFADFVVEHAFDITSVFVHHITVEDAVQATSLLLQHTEGADFVELMREHSLTYNPETLMVDEDGALIEHTNIWDTAISLDFEQVMVAYEMEIGQVSDIIALENGNFAIFQIADIHEMEMSVVEEIFRPQFEDGARFDFLNNQLMIWREQSAIEQNSRIFSQN